MLYMLLSVSVGVKLSMLLSSFSGPSLSGVLDVFRVRKWRYARMGRLKTEDLGNHGADIGEPDWDVESLHVGPCGYGRIYGLGCVGLERGIWFWLMSEHKVAVVFI
jgi:hypothetical protein